MSPVDDYHDPGDEWERTHPYEWTCKKHGHGYGQIDECPHCMEESYRYDEGDDFPHGLCVGCDKADRERSNGSYTWCYGWSKEGFPVRPRKKYCAKFVAYVEPPYDSSDYP